MTKISVIIPIIEDTDELKRVIYSVLHQNFEDFEIIICANTEITLPVKDLRIKLVISKGRNSIPALINESLNCIDSEFICFLKPNDLILYDALKLRYSEFENNPDLVACYGLGIDTDLDFKVKSPLDYEIFLNPKMPDIDISALLSREIYPSISSLMIKTEIFRYLKLNPKYNISYDWDLFIRLFINYKKSICQLKTPVYITRNHEYNIKLNHKGYFIRSLNESLNILDSLNDIDNRNTHYRNLYYSSYFMWLEFFPDDFLLKAYLLISYLKANYKLEGRLLELWFLAILLNICSYSKFNKQVVLA